MAAQPQPAPTARTGITKLNTTIDQGVDGEVPTVKDNDVIRMYQAYETRMGKPPAEDREPSVDQITAIQFLLAQSAPPYVDFSVFGPHSIRLRKRMKLGGFYLSSDGSLQRCELFGPSTFSDWSKCYKVLTVALIMLEAVMPEELDAYHEVIREFAGRYGDRCWPTIYQADVRMRQERMQAIRRRGVALWNQDQAAATRAGFSNALPWRYAWNETVSDASFWLREAQEKCLLILTKVAKEESTLDGDVVTASPGLRALPAVVDSSSGPVARDRSPRRPIKEASKDKGGKRDTKQHNLDGDGLFRTNRSGKELCDKFQRGQCGAASFGNNACPSNKSRAHQCAKCLSSEHGAFSPAACTRETRTPSTPKGKGKRSKG